MKHSITCIVCPRGCRMTAEVTETGITVTGHACARGERHAVGECTNPVRTLTSAVRVADREDCMVSVKSAAPIPREKLFDAVALLRAARAHAPIHVGDVILPGVFGTDIIATKEVL